MSHIYPHRALKGRAIKNLSLPLLLPTLLGGCSALTTRPPSQDIPALVFVDGQIRESADTIALTQQRLAPVPVVAPARVSAPGGPHIAPPPPATLPATSGLIVSGTPGTVAVLSLSPAHNLPLEQWVRRIIPASWTLAYENALRQKLNTRIVSVDTNDQWTRVLEKLLREQSVSGKIDWNTQTVTLQRAGQSFPLSAPPSPHAAASTPRNPFRGTSSTAVSPRPGTPAAGAPAVSLSTPVMPAITGRTWQAPAGKTLREVLSGWVSAQPCVSGAATKWTLIWPEGVTDYRLDAPLTFHGSFETMLAQVFDLYRTARAPLYAEASRLQCLVSVSDSPAEP